MRSFCAALKVDKREVHQPKCACLNFKGCYWVIVPFLSTKRQLTLCAYFAYLASI